MLLAKKKTQNAQVKDCAFST